ncbi:MAG: carboxypeptidase regulatory-like domain-containing protein [Planctomycetota bacterium]
MFGVAGTVRDADEQPIAGATVRFLRRDPTGSKLEEQTTSDADGRFCVRARASSMPHELAQTWRIEADAPGCATSIVDELPVLWSTYEIGNIYARAPVVVRGRVTNEGGAPIAGARIHAHAGPHIGPNPDFARVEPLAVTDADGTYAFESLAPGTVTIGASADGHADEEYDALELAARRAPALDFTLLDEVPIRVLVRGADAKPLEGAEIELVDDHSTVSVLARPRASWRGAVRTSASGEAVIHGLARADVERFDVSVRSFGHRDAVVDIGGLLRAPIVVLEAARILDIEVVPTADVPNPVLARVRARASRGGAGHTCGTCEAMSWTLFQSDSERVRKIGDRHWRVTWRDLERSPELGAVQLEDGASIRVGADAVRWSGDTLVAKCTPPGVGSIRGRVLDEDDRPIARGVVSVSTFALDDSSTVRHFETDDHGRFVAADLGANHYDVRVTSPSGRTADWLFRTVRSGDAIDVGDVVCRPRGDVALVEGRVLRAGIPVESAVVGVWQSQRDVPKHPSGIVLTRADGSFAIPAYDDGEHALVIVKRPASAGQGGYRSFVDEFQPAARALVDAGGHVEIDIGP